MSGSDLFRGLFGTRRPGGRFDSSSGGVGWAPQMTPAGYDHVEPTGFIGDDSIDTAQIVANAITETEILDDSISTPKLQANAVTTAKIAVGQVRGDQLYGDPKNLLPYPGGEYFEDGLTSNVTPPGWTFATGANVRRDAANMRSGRSCFQFISPDGAGASPFAASIYGVEVGKSYRARAWVRGYFSNTGSVTAGIRVYWYQQDGTFISTGAPTGAADRNVTTSTPYLEIVGDVTAPALAYQAKFVVQVTSLNTDDRLYADDLEFFLADRDVTAASGSVVIDSSGITITDGALSFADAYGQTSMDGYGFGPQWLRFVINRVFNGDFTAGSTSDIAVTETGGADTVAEYKASVTSNLPGWVVKTSGGTLKLVTDSTATGGYAIQSTNSAGGQTNSFYQDIPVIPGETPRIKRNWRMTRTSNDVAINIYASYRDSTHAIIGSESGSGLTFSSTIASYVQTDDILAVGVAPANASYLRYRVEIVHNTGTGTTVWISDIKYENDTSAVSVQGTADLTLTTSYADITSLTTTVSKGRNYLVIWAIEFEMSTAGVGDMTAQLVVDGSSISPPYAFFTAPTATARATVGNHLVVSTSPTGSSIIKIQAKKSINAGTAKAIAANSSMTVIPL